MPRDETLNLCLFFFSFFSPNVRVIGLPSEEEWPTDVTLSRKNFPSASPSPITDFVPEINESGAQLLLVRSLKPIETVSIDESFFRSGTKEVTPLRSVFCRKC